MLNKYIYDVSVLELSPASNTAGHGGTIDFHYNQSTDDYTYRIVEGSTALFLRGDKAVIKEGATGSPEKGFRVVDSAKTNNDAYTSSNNDSVGFNIFDKDGHVMARMFHRRASDGGNYAVFEACRTINGTNYWNHIYVGLNASGQQVYAIQNQANFRSAIGLSTSATTTVGNIATANTTNATISSASYVQYGNVAQIRIIWKNKNAISVPATGDVSNIAICTLVSGKRPAIISTAMSNGNNGGPATYVIETSGTITLTRCEGTGAARTIAADNTFDICCTYILP